MQKAHRKVTGSSSDGGGDDEEKRLEMSLSEADEFYISTDADIRRCRESLQKRLPITVTGTTENHRVETFTGIVQSLEYLRHNPANMCWRVTMRVVPLQGDSTA